MRGGGEQGTAVAIHSVLPAADIEPVQVHVFPAERDLQHLVEISDRALGTHEQASPNQRTDATEHSAQLVNVFARFRLRRHRRRLYLHTALLHPQDPVTLPSKHFSGSYPNNPKPLPAASRGESQVQNY